MRHDSRPPTTAATADERGLVFPEYFTVQLLTLGDVRRPIGVQVRVLAAQGLEFVDCMGTLAKRHALHGELAGGA